MRPIWWWARYPGPRSTLARNISGMTSRKAIGSSWSSWKRPLRYCEHTSSVRHCAVEKKTNPLEPVHNFILHYSGLNLEIQRPLKDVSLYEWDSFMQFWSEFALEVRIICEKISATNQPLLHNCPHTWSEWRKIVLLLSKCANDTALWTTHSASVFIILMLTINDEYVIFPPKSG